MKTKTKAQGGISVWDVFNLLAANRREVEQHKKALCKAKMLAADDPSSQFYADAVVILEQSVADLCTKGENLQEWLEVLQDVELWTAE